MHISQLSASHCGPPLLDKPFRCPQESDPKDTGGEREVEHDKEVWEVRRGRRDELEGVDEEDDGVRSLGAPLRKSSGGERNVWEGVPGSGT